MVGVTVKYIRSVVFEYQTCTVLVIADQRSHRFWWQNRAKLFLEMMTHLSLFLWKDNFIFQYDDIPSLRDHWIPIYGSSRSVWNSEVFTCLKWLRRCIFEPYINYLETIIVKKCFCTKWTNKGWYLKRSNLYLKFSNSSLF